MKKVTTLNWILSSAVAVVLIALVGFVYKLYEAASTVDLFKALCSSFFLVGFLFLAVGGLIWCVGEGVFYGLGFSVRQLFVVLRSRDSFEKRQSYGDYCKEKGKKEKPVFAHLVVIGLILVVISLAFLAVYMSINVSA